MATLLRKALPEDAPYIIKAHVRSIREICARDYSPEQVEDWAGRDFKVERWHDSIANEVVWVVEHQGRIEGFGHWTKKVNDFVELRGLYFTPTVKGMGFGKKLMELLNGDAKTYEAGKITLNATLTALEFYKAQGFKNVSCSKQTVQMQGVDIPCHPMEKSLN